LKNIKKRINGIVNKESQITSSSRAITVRIGDVCCALVSQDKEISGHLKRLYASFLTDKPADITLELDIVERIDTPPVDPTPPSTKIFKWGKYIAAVCRDVTDKAIDAVPRVRATAERLQFDPRYGCKIMNLLFPSVYYTIYNKKFSEKPRAMLIHACGILREGKLVIFTGPSETGKTTIARLCGNKYGQVINDEMLLVTEGTNRSGLMIQGIPIIGGVKQRSNIKAPPVCVMMLKQAEKTSVRPLDRVEAYRRFLRQVITQRHLLEHDDIKTMLTKTSEFADILTKAIPCYELAFTLDKEPLWQAVAETEESIRKGKITV
jgi:hypothetical protein